MSCDYKGQSLPLKLYYIRSLSDLPEFDRHGELAQGVPFSFQSSVSSERHLDLQDPGPFQPEHTNCT